MSRGQVWFDDEAGPLVRPYAVTRGRTRSPQVELDMITLVVALQAADHPSVARLDPEHVEILSRCQRPTSVAEIAAALRLPLSVVKILISDLIERQLVIFRAAATADIHVLEAVINGIRRL
jgi:Protein of unknown function (DUF742)